METEKNDYIRIFKDHLDLRAVKELAEQTFGDMAKAVVDIQESIIAVGGELHADAEALLLQKGSKQNNLWGINLYPHKTGDQFIEYTSLINIRPSVNNRSQEIQDPAIRQQVKNIVTSLLKGAHNDFCSPIG